MTPSPVQISTSTHTYTIPSNTKVMVSLASLQTSPRLWGPDVLSFRPSRWLLPDNTFFEPPKGAYLPWSAGPRVCPGYKMSQVEFVAVLFTIFRTWTCGPVCEEGENMEMARERLKAVVANSRARITLKMVEPRKLVLRWSRR
jgi:cytochrome P450